MIIRKSESKYRRGLFAALLAMGLWGLFPLYWNLLAEVPYNIITAYRVFTMGLIVCCIVPLTYPMKDIVAPLKDKKQLVSMIFAGALIAFNWSTYIWAVNNGQVLQTSLGYYIEPLFVCAIGSFIFKEVFHIHKILAICFAAAGVLILLIYFHQIPKVALILPATFATYAALKKKVEASTMISLYYENILLIPVAIAYIVHRELAGEGALATVDLKGYILLMFSGFVTFVPLALFTVGAKNLPLVTLGIVGYLSPTLAFLIGTFVFNESPNKVLLIAFAVIWVGLLIFTRGEILEHKGKLSVRGKDED